MLYIDVPDMNDSISEITIDEIEYGIRFTYSEKYDSWTFGIYEIGEDEDEDEENPILFTKIVPNFPLLYPYLDARLPDGIFGCLSDNDYVGRESFNDGSSEFVFIPWDEVIDDDDDGEDEEDED